MSEPVPTHVGRKIEKVVRTSTSSKSDLEFHYDAMGNRICKIVKPRAGSGILGQENWTYTYYERDAQGNIIATYDRIFRSITGGFTEKYNLKENDLYGSSRTGIRNTSLEVAAVNLTTSGHHSDQTLNVTAVSAGSGTALSTTIFNHKLGEKSYELVNHLGNVLVTVSDMRTANHASTTVTGFNAVVNSAQDFYSYGSIQAGRSYQSSNYKYSMNGQEKDEELGSGVTTAENWEYDAKLGRRWNIDPVKKPWESSYAAFANNPILYSDPNGLDPVLPASTSSVATTLNYTFVRSDKDQNGKSTKDVVKFTQKVTQTSVTWEYDKASDKITRKESTITFTKEVTMERTQNQYGQDQWKETTNESVSSTTNVDQLNLPGSKVESMQNNKKTTWQDIEFRASVTNTLDPLAASNGAGAYTRQSSVTNSSADVPLPVNYADNPLINVIDNYVQTYKGSDGVGGAAMGQTLFTLPNTSKERYLLVATLLTNPGAIAGTALGATANQARKDGFFNWNGKTETIYSHKQEKPNDVQVDKK